MGGVRSKSLEFRTTRSRPTQLAVIDGRHSQSLIQSVSAGRIVVIDLEIEVGCTPNTEGMEGMSEKRLAKTPPSPLFAHR